MEERLQKVLAKAGLGSRRQMEDWIREGRVEVDGKCAELGQKVSETQRIVVDGRRLHLKPENTRPPEVIVYHKPLGEICSRDDPEGRPTVFHKLPKPQQGRWISVGRLDINTSGLLLLTTDGELAHRLMHPSQEIEREYAVRLLGEVNMPMLERLIDGVELDDGMAHFAAVEESGGTGANRWFHVILKEGRNREVRRLWESQGVKISRLTRVRYGPVILERKLRKGQARPLLASEMKKLYEAVGLDVPVIVSAAPEKKLRRPARRPQQHARRKHR
ncbi:MAG TPA: pseudouridine synthase [Gammaproteobacteria bacterium]|nr:pseudouridine synthase [Gammaproteobacteria bacterium]